VATDARESKTSRLLFACNGRARVLSNRHPTKSADEDAEESACRSGCFRPKAAIPLPGHSTTLGVEGLPIFATDADRLGVRNLVLANSGMRRKRRGNRRRAREEGQQSASLPASSARHCYPTAVTKTADRRQPHFNRVSLRRQLRVDLTPSKKERIDHPSNRAATGHHADCKSALVSAHHRARTALTTTTARAVSDIERATHKVLPVKARTSDTKARSSRPDGRPNRVVAFHSLARTSCAPRFHSARPARQPSRELRWTGNRCPPARLSSYGSICC